MAGGPHRPIEHLMVAGVVAVFGAAHDAQRRRHGALAWGQYRADQYDLGFQQPGWVAKQRGEGMEHGPNGIGQGEHGWAFRGKCGLASLPCLYTFSNFCAKSSLGAR